MNYVQDLFLVVVFVHIASGPAALLLLLLLGYPIIPGKKHKMEAANTPAEGAPGCAGLASWSRCGCHSPSLGVMAISSSLGVL